MDWKVPMYPNKASCPLPPLHRGVSWILLPSNSSYCCTFMCLWLALAPTLIRQLVPSIGTQFWKINQICQSKLINSHFLILLIKNKYNCWPEILIQLNQCWLNKFIYSQLKLRHLRLLAHTGLSRGNYNSFLFWNDNTVEEISSCQGKGKKMWLKGQPEGSLWGWACSASWLCQQQHLEGAVPWSYKMLPLGKLGRGSMGSVSFLIIAWESTIISK